MRLVEIIKIMGLCSMVFFALGYNSTVLAENNDENVSCVYISFALLYNSFGGEFDGKLSFDFEEEIIYVPKVKSNYGFGVMLGSRFKFRKNSSVAAELGYYRSTHDYTHLQTEGGSVFSNMLLLSAKYYFPVNKTIQPFLNGEMAWSWLIVKNGLITSVGPPEVAKIGDASYRGLALGVGGGITYYLHPKVSINAGIILRWLMMNSAKGEFKEAHDINNLMAISPNFTIGITYTIF